MIELFNHNGTNNTYMDLGPLGELAVEMQFFYKKKTGDQYEFMFIKIIITEEGPMLGVDLCHLLTKEHLLELEVEIVAQI